jgi:ribosomal protein S18 acetylase RimI-like enzyme
MSLAMRRLTAADGPAFQTLRAEALSLHPRDFLSTPEEEAARPLPETEATLARDHYLGLFDGETLVGIAGLAVHPKAKCAHKAEIRSVYVRAAQRGAGAAERLLRGLLEEAAGKVEEVRLGVSEGNGPALRLYTRLGFSQEGVEPRAIKLADGDYCAEITMVRRMPDAEVKTRAAAEGSRAASKDQKLAGLSIKEVISEGRQ